MAYMYINVVVGETREITYMIVHMVENNTL